MTTPRRHTGDRAPIHVMHLLYQLNIGGMEVGVVNLGNMLPRADIRTSICSSIPAGDLKDRLQPGTTVHNFQRRSGHDLRFVYELYRVFRQERPTIVHTHGWGTLVEGLAAARLAGVPFVVHGEHGTMDLRQHTRRIQRWVWRRCDRVLSVSSRLADRMAAETGFPRERIQTIRNGVDHARFAAASAQRGREIIIGAASAPIVSIIGRLVPVKGHEVYLRSLANLRERGVAFQGVIIGDGVRRQELEQLARDLGLSAAVRFVGHHENVADLLAASDVFVLSSHSEGLSNTILEAMAAGLPVVATHVGGADELVTPGVNGLLVPKNNPDALAAAIADVLADPTRRRQMGVESRRIVETRFTMARMVEEYRDMYLSVAQRRPQAVRHAA